MLKPPPGPNPEPVVISGPNERRDLAMDYTSDGGYEVCIPIGGLTNSAGGVDVVMMYRDFPITGQFAIDCSTGDVKTWADQTAADLDAQIDGPMSDDQVAAIEQQISDLVDQLDGNVTDDQVAAIQDWQANTLATKMTDMVSKPAPIQPLKQEVG